MNYSITTIHFSPSGTTAKVAAAIAAGLSGSAASIDLLREPVREDRHFQPEEVVIVALPVFAGRIPKVCAQMLGNLKGDGAMAIAVVVYGNRAYEDALLELTDLLKENGFAIAGAGAVVAQHSIFPKVAQNRPDSADIQKSNDFAARCAAAIASGKTNAVTVPGNRPYRAAGKLPLSVSASSRCNACGACSKICPVGAISADSPRVTDGEKCINCTACISVCPRKARKYRGIKYQLGARGFAKRCAARREAEYFVSE